MNLNSAADIAGFRRQLHAHPELSAREQPIECGRVYLLFQPAEETGTDQPQLHDDGYDYPDELIEVGSRLYRALIDRCLAEE